MALVMEGGYTWGPRSTLSAKALDSTEVKKLLGSDSPYLRATRISPLCLCSMVQQHASSSAHRARHACV